MMPRLPPAERLPLALRRNIRDDFDAKRAEFEQELSQTLGQPWTIAADFNAIFPYASKDWIKQSLGSSVARYTKSAIFQLGGFKSQYGDEGVAELNILAYEHVLTIDVDEKGENNITGVAILDGRLAILFNEKELGTNDDYALEIPKLVTALYSAPSPLGASWPAALRFVARLGIRKDYEPGVCAVQAAIALQLNNETIQLAPDFEGLAARLGELAKDPATKDNVPENWEESLGALVLQYYKGLAFNLQTNRFSCDDLLQEGFAEAVDKSIIAIRIADSALPRGDSQRYNKVVIEDGQLIIEVEADAWGVNTEQAGRKIVDLL